jgi:hypothetical protein
MTSEELAAAILGCSRNKIRQWREQGAPLYIGYACRAIANGMTPWGKDSEENRREKRDG